MDPSTFSVFRSVLLTELSAMVPGLKKPDTDEPTRKLIGETERILKIPSGRPAKPRLQSIFNCLNTRGENLGVLHDGEGRFAGFGTGESAVPAKQADLWKRQVEALPASPEYANAMLELAEDCFSTVPSGDESVSAYHMARTAAAVACCLCLDRKSEGAAGKPFVLYSLAFSGIQGFIYNIVSTGALKALKSRSLYLSVMTEHVADLILEETGLPRANLIYAGGGRAHLLLPSGAGVPAKAQEAVRKVNAFLGEHFGADLFLADGFVEAGPGDLDSEGGRKGTFSALFAETSRRINERKNHRYTFEELIRLNEDRHEDGLRECAVCGKSDRLTTWKELHLCHTCAQLERFAGTFDDHCDELSIVAGSRPDGLQLPSLDGSPLCLVAGSTSDALRVYTLNARRPLPGACRIWISRHQPREEEGKALTLNDLAKSATGVRRLGVLRADVDGLGLVFSKGLINSSSGTPWKRCTLAHYAALSGAMTWFFQGHLDAVLEDPSTSQESLKADPACTEVSVVYAGGDDVFLIGAWNAVLDAGLKIERAFSQYTGGKVTLSAGFGVFASHTPVQSAAKAAAELEAMAKRRDGKNAIALFGRDMGEDGKERRHVYSWKDFREEVLNGRLDMLEHLFETMPDKGNSFLYHVLHLYRKITGKTIAIAQLAYLLSRHAPSEKQGAGTPQVAAYKEFMKNVYAWALDPVRNLQFQTACMLYVYLNRTESDTSQSEN